MRNLNRYLSILLSIILLLSASACSVTPEQPPETNPGLSEDITSTTVDFYEDIAFPTDASEADTTTVSQTTHTTPPLSIAIPKPVSASDYKYTGKPYAIVNNNQPVFREEDLSTKGYENYSPLDNLGRCGTARAVCGTEIMPKPDEERGSISSIKPSGWKQAKYTGTVPNGYLWNRCHLIGWQLSAENANKCNLITGTRYMNVEGMLPFENMVADYIRETGNHVAYRVTPVYDGNNLVCSGVQLEAYSVEDKGDGICFNVYCFNVQPEITINYSDGSSSLNKR